MLKLVGSSKRFRIRRELCVCDPTQCVPYSPKVMRDTFKFLVVICIMLSIMSHQVQLEMGWFIWKRLLIFPLHFIYIM